MDTTTSMANALFLLRHPDPDPLVPLHRSSVHLSREDVLCGCDIVSPDCGKCQGTGCGFTCYGCDEPVAGRAWTLTWAVPRSEHNLAGIMSERYCGTCWAVAVGETLTDGVGNG